MNFCIPGIICLFRNNLIIQDNSWFWFVFESRIALFQYFSLCEPTNRKQGEMARRVIFLSIIEVVAFIFTSSGLHRFLLSFWWSPLNYIGLLNLIISFLESIDIWNYYRWGILDTNMFWRGSTQLNWKLWLSFQSFVAVISNETLFVEHQFR